MRRAKMEVLAIDIVQKILAENNIQDDLRPEIKDTLYSICNNAIVMGYQIAYAELLKESKEKLDNINGVKDDIKTKC